MNRRKFLKSVLYGAAAITLPSLSPEVMYPLSRSNVPPGLKDIFGVYCGTIRIYSGDPPANPDAEISGKLLYSGDLADFYSASSWGKQTISLAGGRGGPFTLTAHR